MRDPNRLDYFYETLKNYHKWYFTDWRFSQLIINFLNWHLNKYGTDGFYVEEDEMLKKFNEFKDDIGVKYVNS